MNAKLFCGYWMLVTALAVVSTPSVAAAQAGSPAADAINACVHQGSRQVRIVTAGEACRPNETALQWGAAGSDAKRLTQQDTIQSFDFVTGRGYQTGTASGMIAGTSSVDFQLTPAGAPVGDALPITFTSKVIITDLDGDQVFFDNNGTGTFHLGIPGADFRGAGGPLVGTYVVTGGTGKFASWPVGKTFTYRAILTNPPSPTGALGTVYVEVR